jgi:hypothetical protein
MSYESLFELWITCLSLIGRRAIARTTLHTILLGLYLGFGMHHCSDKHLACGDGMNLGCCEVMVVIVDYGMTIITLDSLYFLLSHRPTPPVIVFVLYGRRAYSRDTCALSGPHLHWEWALRHFGPRLLVDFWCVNTCHVESPDPRSSRCRTYLWNLARGVLSVPL